MNKPLALAAMAAFVLVGAAYPDQPRPTDRADAGAIAQVAPTYPPCRRNRTDDRCIQLYERGVRADYARWLRGRDPAAPPRVAIASAEPPARGPHRRHARHDPRCHHQDGPPQGELGTRPPDETESDVRAM